MKKVDMKKHQIPAYAVIERNIPTMKKVNKVFVREEVEWNTSRHKNINFLPEV